jgi:hypothetical protein
MTAGGRPKSPDRGNIFQTDASHIRLCVHSLGCGFNGLFSNYGTYPRWSPYKTHAVQENITFRQNHLWRNNTYIGNLLFMVEEAGNKVDWDELRAAPYYQRPPAPHVDARC